MPGIARPVCALCDLDLLSSDDFFPCEWKQKNLSSRKQGRRRSRHIRGATHVDRLGNGPLCEYGTAHVPSDIPLPCNGGVPGAAYLVLPVRSATPGSIHSLRCYRRFSLLPTLWNPLRELLVPINIVSLFDLRLMVSGWMVFCQCKPPFVGERPCRSHGPIRSHQTTFAGRSRAIHCARPASEGFNERNDEDNWLNW